MLKDTLDTIPTSTAKTAWGFLRDVQKAILNEPRRANMSCYVRQTSECEGETAPACGTVGCFAGWISLLAGTNPSNDYVRHNAEIIAENLLGRDLNYELRRRVPSESAISHRNEDRKTFYVFNSGGGDGCQNTSYQTPGHAKAVVRRIERFMRQNEAQLRRRRMDVAKAEALGL